MAERSPLSEPLSEPRSRRRRLMPKVILDSEAFGEFAEAAARFMGTGKFIAYMTVFVVVAAIVALGALPSLLIRHLGAQRRKLFARQLPDAMMLIAGAVRAGASMTLALRQMASELPAPGGQEFELMLRELRLGVTLDDALLNLERRMGCDDLRLFGAAVRIANESGGNLAETLERLADTIRKKMALEDKIMALTAQGRMQGWVMVLLPLGVGAALFAIEPTAMAPLLHSWQGWIVCSVVAVLEIVGLLFIRRIMAIDI